jgi:hypothetical protein
MNGKYSQQLFLCNLKSTLSLYLKLKLPFKQKNDGGHNVTVLSKESWQIA